MPNQILLSVYMRYDTRNNQAATGNMLAGHKLLTQAIDLGRHLRDPNAQEWASAGILMFRTAPQHIKQRIQVAEELWASSRADMQMNVAATTVQWIGDAFSLRDSDSVLRSLGRATGHGSAYRNVRLGHLSAGMDSVLALIDAVLKML